MKLNNDDHLKLYIIIGCGVFIILFLGIFKPFGINVSNIWFLLGFGLITTLSCFLHYMLLPYLFHYKLYTHSQRITDNLPSDIANLITIGTGNFLYAAKFDPETSFCWKWFWYYQAYTMSIGLIIMFFIMLITGSVRMKRHLKEVEDLNFALQNQLRQTANRTLIFEAETRNDKLVLYSDDLVCIKAEGNYSMFFYLLGDKVSSKLLRLSLKNAEEIVGQHPCFSRSHRSYIINVNKITRIQSSGNNYQLWVNGMGEPLPASRQNISELRHILKAKPGIN
jgi:hypothetical protein